MQWIFTSTKGSVLYRWIRKFAVENGLKEPTDMSKNTAKGQPESTLPEGHSGSTDDVQVLRARIDELEKQIPLLDRAEIARVSIDNNGKIIVAEDLKTVIDIANEIAPEHLELCVDNPFDWLDSIRHAGSVFLGRNCPEALGDYMAGPNHTLPTQGTAKFSSPLSVDDFVKKTQYTYFTREALAALAQDVAAFARKEGLTGHARSAMIRIMNS